MGFLLVYLLLLAAWVLAGLFVTGLSVRRLRHRSVVQTLAVIVAQNLPLPRGLRAAARGEGTALGWVYQRMARRLEAGDSLSAALRSSMLSCPARVTGALEGAERGGTLPTVLRSLAADLRRERAAPGVLGAPAVYSLALLVVLPLVLLFVFVQILPRFRDIFADFEVELPYMTTLVFELGSSRVLGTIGLLPLVVVAVLALSQLAVMRNFLARVPSGLRWLAALVDGVPWWLPLLRRIAETRALARQLPIMQAALRAGHDLAEAARQAACVDANHHARARLRRWADLLEAGGQPVATARRLGFPPPLLRTLAAAAGGAELPTALEYLTSYYRSLAVHWQRVLLSAVMPFAVLMWGLCVGFVVVAVFLPLVALIEGVMASVY